MKILNFGSMNIDNVYRVSHIVRPGETISSLGFQKNPGGKGLNQSITLAKAGMEVWHAGIAGREPPPPFPGDKRYNPPLPAAVTGHSFSCISAALLLS